MRQLKTAAAAWRWLGREMEKAQAMPTIPGVYRGGGYQPHGLCACIAWMYDARWISHDTMYVMDAQIESHMQALNETRAKGTSYQVYADKPGRFQARVMIVEILAQEAELAARRGRAEERSMNKQILKASEAIGDDEGYLARTNAVVEGAYDYELEAGSGGEGFDEPSNHESLNTDLDIDDEDDDWDNDDPWATDDEELRELREQREMWGHDGDDILDTEDDDLPF